MIRVPGARNHEEKTGSTEIPTDGGSNPPDPMSASGLCPLVQTVRSPSLILRVSGIDQSDAIRKLVFWKPCSQRALYSSKARLLRLRNFHTSA